MSQFAPPAAASASGDSAATTSILPARTVDLRRVVKDYLTDAGAFRAIDGVSMTVEAGEFIAVVGKSGCGKSTLLNMITGIDRPTAGEVWVAGTEVSRLSERTMAGWRGINVGVIFQFFQLLPTLSVIENVMLPMDFAGRGTTRERRERALDLLEQVEMADQADKLPLSTSGGQQQRVAIARALANDPPVLVADEPTGNLDSVTADAVFELFRGLAAAGKTVIMVTHDADLPHERIGSSTWSTAGSRRSSTEGIRMFSSVRWRKVRGDLGQYRARTALVVASIAIGAFAVGTIAGTDTLLRQNLNDGYAAIRPAAASIFTATGFDRELVDVVRGMPGVADAEGRRSVVVRLLEADGTSREMLLTALPDYANQRIDIVEPEQGRFPPRRGEVAFERSALRLMDVAPGDRARVRAPGGREYDLEVSGLAHEPGTTPAFYLGRVNAYVTFETLEDLGWDDAFDELRIRVDDPTATRDDVREIADDVRTRLERAGVTATFSLVPEPGQHPANDLLQAVFVVLGGIGLLSLVMSGFLVANTVSVIVTQQIRQIGLMKAVGGSDLQIAGIYLALVLAYGLLALAIAVPAAALGAYALTSLAAGLLNFDVTDPLIPLSVVGVEIAIGLFVPLVAGAVPVWRGVRMTVREAIRDSSGADHYGHGRLDALLARFRGLSRPALLSIRNTFRRKTRLVLTLAALALGGTVFMTVFTVRDSLYSTLDDTVRYFNYDVQIELTESARAATVTAEALKVPGVVVAEPWRFSSGQRIRPDGTESPARVMFGLPPDATTVRPVLVEGRWLLPGEGNALVATNNLFGDEPDLGVGDELTLRIQGRDTTWTLVGIVESPTFAPFLYVGSDALERTLGDVGRIGIVMIGTDDHSPAAQARIGTEVRDRLEAAGIGVAATTSTSDVTTTLFTAFDTLVLFISVMAVLLGVVGGLGLAGTMTMNVVERSREIGVIRAIGATDQAVLLIFLAEGLLIGLIAWMVGALLSLPVSFLLSDALGQAFVQRPLDYQVSWQGFILWFIVVFWLSTIGSILPAWRAARMTVREVLAYE